MIRPLIYVGVLAALFVAPLPALAQSSDGGEPGEEAAAETEAQSQPEKDDERVPESPEPESDSGGDFRPREEISEDYPVPLPADI